MADDATDTRGSTGVGERTPVSDRRHPVHVFAGRLSAALAELAGASTVGLGFTETTETTVELQRAAAQLRGLQLAVLAHADVLDVAASVDATSTAAWLRSLVPVTGPAATREVKLATALDRGVHAPVAAALAGGQVLPEQAAVVVAAVDALPATVSVQDRRTATEHLVDLAAVHDAAALRVLGRHVLEVLDPDAADEQLARQLEAEETSAARRTSLSLVDDGHGTTTGRFRVPTLVGEMLRTALHALANPGRPDPVPRTEPHDDSAGTGIDSDDDAAHAKGFPRAAGRRRATPAVLGDAFVEYVQRYPTDQLPTTGGVAATVVVTIPLATLEGRLKAADLLGTTHQLSPGAARRLACTTGVLPAVLDTDSHVLDLGRRTRLATRPQRLALTVQQSGTCGIEHCDRPTTWADAHHAHRRWTDGGRTDLTDLVLLCTRHHTLTHLPGRTLTHQPTGRYRIQRT